MAMLGWSALNFELLLIFSPLVSRTRAVEAAQAVVQKFIAREKDYLFLLCDKSKC